MAVTHNRFTVGTALAQVVADSADSQEVWLQNLSPADNPADLARNGELYLVEQSFALSGNGTALFSVETGANGLQFESYRILTTTSSVLAELIEGASVSETGASIPAYNINRNFPDSYDAVFKAATAITGGSVVSAEFLTGSFLAGGSSETITKIHTLAGSSQYGFRFVNQSGVATTCFLQIAFSEKFNGQHEIWVGNAVGTGVRIKGGETVHMSLIQGQKLFAVAQQDNELMVTRQD